MKSFTSLLVCMFLMLGFSYICAESVNDEQKSVSADNNNEFKNKLNLLLSTLESEETVNDADDQSDEDEDGGHQNAKRLAYRYGKRMSYRYGKRAAMPYRFGKRNSEANGLNAQEVLDFLRMNPNTENKRLSYRYGK